jgi:oligosaccharide repeat unit polymerase
MLETLSSAAFALGLIAAICTFLSASVAFRRLTRHSSSDGLGIFAAFFTGYNGLLLLNIALAGGTRLDLATYPVSFSNPVYLGAGLLSLVAAVGLSSTNLLLDLFRSPGMPGRTAGSGLLTPTRLFTVGVLLFVVGLTMLFQDYSRAGGYFSLFNMDRTERYVLLSAAQGSLPYTSFVEIGFAMVAYADAISKRKAFRWALRCMLALWTVLLIAQGDRRLVAYVFIIVFAVRSTLRRSRLKVTLKRSLLVIVAFVSVMTYGQLRFLIFGLAIGQMSTGEAMTWIAENASLSWAFPSEGEFAGPYITLLDAVDREKGLRGGETYLEAIPQILPRALYPGQKPESLANKFSAEMAGRGGLEIVSGWGFSPVAEAYINLGTVGVFCVFVLLAGFFVWFGRIRYRNPFSLVIYAALLPQALNANRVNFANVLQEVVFLLVVSLIGFLLCSVPLPQVPSLSLKQPVVPEAAL